MAVKETWHIRYACGHEADRDLSALRPSERAGKARFYASGDCGACWRDKKRTEDTNQWREHKRVEQAGWERATGMPALAGSEKAVAWAGRVRYQLLTAAYEHATDRGMEEETFAATVEAPARTITSASWWIDQRDTDPADVAELVADAAANPAVHAGTENPY